MTGSAEESSQQKSANQWGLGDFFAEAVRLTNDPALWDKATSILAEQNDLRRMLDEPSGATRVCTRLRSIERELQRMASSKTPIWDRQFELFDRLGRVRIARDALEGQYAEGSSERRDRVNRIAEGIHRIRLDGIRGLLRCLKNPLREYRRAQLRDRLVVRLGYLSIAILIFVVGASAIDHGIDRWLFFAVGARAIDLGIDPWLLKLGVATSIWAFEEFLFTPWVDERLERHAHTRLDNAIQSVASLRCWIIAATAIAQRDLDASQIAASGLQDAGIAKPA